MRSTPTFQIITLRLREAQLQPSRNWQDKWKGWPCRGNRVPEGRVRVPQAALPPPAPRWGMGLGHLGPSHLPTLRPELDAREPRRRLLSPQGPGGAAGWGRGAPPNPPPSPAGGGSAPGLPGQWLRFWFHFPRPGLSPFPSPEPFEFLAPFPLSGLSSNVTSSGRLSRTTLAAGTSLPASLLPRPICILQVN